MGNHTSQSSDGRIDETTAAFDARSTELSKLSEHAEETHSVERNWSTSAAPVLEAGHEGNTQNASQTTTDASTSTLQKPSSVALSETDGNSGLQSVYSSEPQLNASAVASTVAHESVFVSEMTSPLVTLEDNNRGVTSVYGSVLEESTTGTFKPEPSDAEATVKSSSGTFNMSSLETESEKADAVTSDSHASSTDPTITAESEPTTILLSAGWHADVTGTLDSADANTTISELTTGTSDNFTVSEVEYPSQEKSDSSFQHANVSEVVVSTPNATTASSLSSSAEERGLVTDIHVPSERQHTSSRTVEDTSTTDTPSAHLSTSEATRTLHTNATGPVTRTQFYSQAGDQFSTVSEIASEAPYGSTSSSNGQFIGIAVGASVGVVILVIIIIIIIVAVLYRRNRRQSCYISNDYDLKDYRSLMKQRPHDATAMASPSVAQPISPFCDVFPQDVANNGLPASKYRMMNFDRNSDDGLDGIEIVHNDPRAQRSPKEIPIEEYDPNPSGYSDCSYSVNTFRPPERKSEKKSTDLTQPEAETKLDANKSSGNDEKAIEE